MRQTVRVPKEIPKELRRERPIVAPTFGARLMTLRGARSRGVICRMLRQYGLELDRSTLLQYERGTVGSPDPAILWALGRIYHVSIDDLVLDLVRDRTRRPVPAAETRGPLLTDDQLRAVQYLGQLDDDSRGHMIALLADLAARPGPTLAPKPRPVPKVNHGERD